MAKTNQGFKLAPVSGPRETTLDHITYRSYNEVSKPQFVFVYICIVGLFAFLWFVNLAFVLL